MVATAASPPRATKESVIVTTTTTTDDVNSPLSTASTGTCVATCSHANQKKSPGNPILPPMDSYATLRELSKTNTDDDDPDYNDDNDQYKNDDDDKYDDNDGDNNDNNGGGKCSPGTTNKGCV